jgi:hypothetical protein
VPAQGNHTGLPVQGVFEVFRALAVSKRPLSGIGGLEVSTRLDYVLGYLERIKDSGVFLEFWRYESRYSFRG